VERATHWHRRGGERGRHPGIPEQVFGLRAIPGRFRRQLRQPAEFFGQPARRRGRLAGARRETAVDMPVVAAAAGEPREALFGAVEPILDRRDPREGAPDPCP